MNKQRIEFDVHAFIHQYPHQQFSVSDVTQAYFNSSLCKHKSLKSARQYFYRHLQHLLKTGTVSLTNALDGKSIIYELTNTKEKLGSDAHMPDATSPSRLSVRDRLIDKIKQTKSALLTSMGETEAYSEWANETPQLSDEVKDLYKSSRDKTSMLLGKVSGYESLLSLYQGRM